MRAVVWQGPGKIDLEGTVPPESGRPRLVASALVSFATALVLTACGSGSPGASAGSGAPSTTPSGAASGLPDLIARAEPSIVTVRTSSGLGSGVVYRSDVVVTNQHVVGTAPTVALQFADGTTAPGQVLASDEVSDVAVIRSARGGLPTIPLRTDLPRQGETALALGSPLGLENTATSGIVSAVGRELPGRVPGTPLGLIQTDAPISPGNSGGALIDAQGRLMGLNEIYIPPGSGAVALGFAIPSQTVSEVADQLLSTGRVAHPYLGVSLAELTPEIRDRLGVRAPAGAVVTDVAAGGPADRAGVRVGDVVTAFAGRPVTSVQDVVAPLSQTRPGQSVPLTVVRGPQTLPLAVTVGDRPMG